MITSGADDVEIDHNTFVPTNYLAFVMTGLNGHDASGKVIGKPCKRFKLTNNIMGFGLYGAGVDGGQNTFAEAFPDMTWDKNLFVGYGEGRARVGDEEQGLSRRLPVRAQADGQRRGTGDADWPAVGFADSARRRLPADPGEQVPGAGTDGKDLGADMDAIDAATRRGPLRGAPEQARPAHSRGSRPLADDSWLELGSPEADPRWGRRERPVMDLGDAAGRGAARRLPLRGRAARVHEAGRALHGRSLVLRHPFPPLDLLLPRGAGKDASAEDSMPTASKARRRETASPSPTIDKIHFTCTRTHSRFTNCFTLNLR